MATKNLMTQTVNPIPANTDTELVNPVPSTSKPKKGFLGMSPLTPAQHKLVEEYVNSSDFKKILRRKGVANAGDAEAKSMPKENGLLDFEGKAHETVMVAAGNYDLSKGNFTKYANSCLVNSFKSYTFWGRREGSTGDTKLNRRQNLIEKINNPSKKDSFWSALDRKARIQKVAELLNVSYKVVKRDADAALDVFFSIDIEADDGSQLFDPPSLRKSIVDECMDNERHVWLADNVEALSTKNATVLKLYLEGMIKKDIASVVGISKGRVSQIINEFIEKMQKKVAANDDSCLY